jgi:hypothetical protein
MIINTKNSPLSIRLYAISFIKMAVLQLLLFHLHLCPIKSSNDSFTPGKNLNDIQRLILSVFTRNYLSINHRIFFKIRCFFDHKLRVVRLREIVMLRMVISHNKLRLLFVLRQATSITNVSESLLNTSFNLCSLR